MLARCLKRESREQSEKDRVKRKRSRSDVEESAKAVKLW